MTASRGTDLPSSNRALMLSVEIDREKLKAGIAAYARSCYWCHEDRGTPAAATACELAHEDALTTKDTAHG